MILRLALIGAALSLVAQGGCSMMTAINMAAGLVILGLETAILEIIYYFVSGVGAV